MAAFVNRPFASLLNQLDETVVVSNATEASVLTIGTHDGEMSLMLMFFSEK